MKRIFVLMLSILMLLNFAACGKSTEEPKPDATVSATIPAESTEAPTAAPTQPPVTAVDTDKNTLVDNENAAFSIIRVENNAHMGMQLQVQCVNKTDRTLLFSWDMVSVCGFMYDPFWAEEVAAGKTANSTIYLDTYQLAKMDVESVDEISFTLRIVDSENWMEAPLVEEAFTVYPTGLNADTVQMPNRAPTDGQVVIADNEDLRFVIEWADSEDASAYTVYVYAENKTDRNLLYAWDLVSVNGFMIDPFWAVSVSAGKKACSEVTFYRSDLEANGITDISQIEFRLLVSDYDDWEADYLLEETYTYNP